MKSHADRSERARFEAEFHEAAGKLPWRRKMDPILVLTLVFALVFLGLAASLVIELARITRPWHRDAVAPVPDDRILVNVRRPSPSVPDRTVPDPGAGSPFRATTYHAADQSVYVSRDDGLVHRLHLPSGLWHTEPIPIGGSDDPLLAFQSGCGRDTPPEACPDIQSLWALGERGGLARRAEGDWQAVTSHTAFLDATGAPVEHTSLLSAAISPDGSLLGLGTDEHGIGVYEVHRRRWIAPDAALLARMPRAPVTQLVWWRGLLWAGGVKGVFGFDPRGDADSFRAVVDLSGSVWAMVVDGQDRLWMATRGMCETEGENCLAFFRLDDPDGLPERIAYERNRFAALNRADLHQAHQYQDRLYLAGDAGLYQYDVRHHGWQRHESSPVVDSLMPRGSGRLFYCAGGALGLVDGSQTQRWEMVGERFFRLVDAGQDRAYALTQQGKAYLLRTSAAPISVFEGSRTQLDPKSFFSAVAIDDHLLFVSREGAMLHDVVGRTYRDIPKSSRVSWLLDRTTELYSSGGHLFALSETGGEVFTRTVPLQRVIDRDLRLPQTLKPVPAPIRAVRDWDGEGLAVLAGDHQAYLLTPMDSRPLMGGGNAPAGLGGAGVLDALVVENGLVVSNRDGLYEYDNGSRTWRAWGPPPVDRHALDLAHYRGEYLLRTNGERLARMNRFRPYLIGGEAEIDIPDDELRDVLLEGNDLFLAGIGRVVQYDMSLRRVTGWWTVARSEDIRLCGVVGKDPLFLVAGKAYLGDRALHPEGGRALSLSYDGEMIWTLLERDKVKYLDRMDPTKWLKRCRFRRGDPYHDAKTLYGVRALPSGNLAVATDRGLQFYSPFSRSWYRTGAPVSSQGGGLYLFDDDLIWVSHEGERQHISVIPMVSIRFPDSCSDDPVILKRHEYAGVGLTVAPESQSLAWIGNQGEIVEWRQGRLLEVAAPPNRGPALDSLRGFYSGPAQDGRPPEDLAQEGTSSEGISSMGRPLIFTTDRELHRYDLHSHSWQRIELVFTEPPSGSLHLNLEGTDSDWLLTVQTAEGAVYWGAWNGLDDQIHCDLQYLPGPTSLGIDGDALRAAYGGTDGVWTFLGEDRLATFDPRQRRWLASVNVDGLAADAALYRLGDRLLVVEAEGEVWRIATSPEPAPSGFAVHRRAPGERTAIDSQGRLWRIEADGALERAEPDGLRYRRFEPEGGKPFFLDPDSVRGAWRWQDRIVFSDAGDLRLLDGYTHDTIELEYGKGFGEVRGVREYAGWFWILSRRGVLLLGESIQERIEETFFPDIDTLAVDARGRMWGRRQGRWLAFQGGSFDERLPGPLVSRGTYRLFVQEDREVTALDAAGIPAQFDEVFTPAFGSLPVAVSEVDFLIPGQRGDWWVLQGNRISRWRTRSGDRGSVTFASAGTFSLAVAEDAEVLDYRLLTSDRLELSFSDGYRFLVDTRAGAGPPAASRIEVDRPRPGRANEWPELAKLVRQTPGGRHVFNPFEGFSFGFDGRLVAKRVDGDPVELAEDGALEPEPLGSLDVGWLRWFPEGRHFTVRTDRGERAFAASQFLRDGQFLFEPLGAVLAYPDGTCLTANHAGIWRLGSGLALNQAQVSFRPVVLEGSIRGVHGGFQAGNGRELVVTPRAPGAERDYRVRFGPVSFVHDFERNRVTFQSRDPKLAGDVYRDGFFLWDRGRRGLVYDHEGRLLIHSEAGFHAARDFGTFDPGPTGVDHRGLVLYPISRGGFTATDGRRWFRRDASGWTVQEAPRAAGRDQPEVREWLDRGDLRYTVTGGQPAWHIERNSFASDRLVDAVAVTGRLHLLTATRHEMERVQVDRREFQSLPFDTPEGARLQPSPNRDGSMYLWVAGTAKRWDDVALGFTDLSSDLDLESTELAKTANLRFARAGRRIHKYLRARGFDGVNRWRLFHFSKRRFPFDVVTGMETFADRLFLATAAGLQEYAGNLDLGLGNMAAWFAGGTGTIDARTALTSIGRDADQPDQLLFRTGAGCARWLPDGSIQTVGEACLEERLRGANRFWRWTRDTAGRVEGRYLDRQGQLSDPIVVRRGRMPHDHLLDVVRFDDRIFSLSRLGWVSRFTKTLALTPEVVSEDFSDAGPRGLICVSETMPLGAVTLQAGVYMHGEGERVWFYENERWRAIQTPAVAKAVMAYARNEPIYDRGRFRLMAPPRGQGFRFEYLDAEDRWRPIDWAEDGRVAIDAWRHLAVRGDSIWAVTAAGMVSFVRSADERLVLMPETARIVAGTSDGRPLASATDLSWRDDALLLRLEQRSEWVYQATVEIPGEGRRPILSPFLRVEADPFVDRLLVSQEGGAPWDWRRVGHADGQPGDLQVSRNGSALPFAAGGFAFDRIEALLVDDAGVLNVATQADGWYRVTGSDLDLHGWQRPQPGDFEANRVTHLGWVPRGSERALGVRLDDEAMLRRNPDGSWSSVAALPAMLGRAANWLYTREPERMVIRTAEGAGLGRRRLIGGRFNDDRIRGFPTSFSDGETPDDIRYAVPTAAGVAICDAALQPLRMVSGPFPGLAETASPAILWNRSGELLYLGRDGFYVLEGQREKRLDLVVPTEGDARVTMLSALDPDRVRLFQKGTAAAGWYWFDVRRSERLGRNTTPLDLSEAPVFLANRPRWGDPPPWHQVLVDSDRLRLLGSLGDREVEVALPRIGVPLEVVHRDNALWIYGTDDMVRVRIGGLLERLYR
ncbi:hypothetical protein SCOR_11955 [Sulfidibacter corallicola]|uniref:Uncharacterized protein n=1 Tax=Sulfidibacter corallicola TaxID=2818388 RepID=A0A8A4TMZ0_SULCO|nr:hypothetical protein [Sulfidibacter corallicola]QTD47955.1 hypothetical protein J3U87_20405 [Sulfidibacter corallicola]